MAGDPVREAAQAVLDDIAGANLVQPGDLIVSAPAVAALRAALSAPADDWHLDKFEQAVSLLGDTQPSASDRELWRDLCEKDDRTSPEEYPDMALIKEDEFYHCLAAARKAGQPSASDPEVKQLAWALCPILLAADEYDMPQIIAGPYDECRKCERNTGTSGGTAGCRLVADVVASAALEHMKSALAARYHEGVEAAAQRIENGSFLHNDAPAARLAKEAAKAIRALLRPEPPHD